MQQPYRKNARFLVRTALILILLLAVNTHGYGEDTAEQTAPAVQSANITEEFRQLFINTCAYMKQCTKYAAQGEIVTHIKCGDEDTQQSYPFVLSRNGIAHFSISVYREGGTDVVLRLLSAGRPGTAKFYLPREINPLTFLARIQEQPEGLTVPVVLMLYDLLEQSRPENWLNTLVSGKVTHGNDPDAESLARLEMVFGSYFSLRDLHVGIPVAGVKEGSPRLAGFSADLSSVLQAMPGISGTNGDITANVELVINNWLPDEPPAVNDFAVPVPRTAYVSVEVSEIFAMANSGVISPQSASLEDIAENPAQVSDLLSKLNFMPSSSLLQKFRTAPVSEQRRVVRQLRNTPAASRLKSKVKQMGLSPQEIQRIRSLAQ